MVVRDARRLQEPVSRQALGQIFGNLHDRLHTGEVRNIIKNFLTMGLYRILEVFLGAEGEQGKVKGATEAGGQAANEAKASATSDNGSASRLA